jgi:hypothetical protein
MNFTLNPMAAAGIRRASTTAGIALLLLAIVSGFGQFAAVQHLVVENNAVKTAAEIAGSETLFRLGVASLLVAAALDIVVAWGLFKVFEPVSSGLSMLTAWFRLAYAAIFVVAIAQLAGVLRLLPGAGGAGKNGLPSQVLSAVHTYNGIWSAGLVVFGVHLVLLGVLVYRAVYAPTILGVLLVIAGLGYAIGGFSVVLFPPGTNVAAYTFIGEVVLIFWLLLRGRSLTPAALAKQSAVGVGERPVT